MCSYDSVRPVCFTPTSPIDVSPGALIFYDVVEPDVVSRSSVLACIAEAEGEARLPEAVTVSDLRTWLTAVEWHVDGQQRKAIAMFTICTVLKVADALDVKGLSEWVQLAAEHLISQLPGTQTWRHRDKEDYARELAEEHADHYLQADIELLETLPDHLQDQVFAAVAASRCETTEDCPVLYMLLDELHDRFYSRRDALCARILAGVVLPSKELHMQTAAASDHFFSTVVSLPASPPHLLSLTVSDHNPPRGPASDTAEQVARILRHHTALSSLRLGAPCHRTDAFQLLAPTLSTLPAMRSLHLGTYSGAIADESFPVLQMILQSMPVLEELKLFCHLSRQSSKRHRDSEAEASPQPCLAIALSPATALTSLHIHVYSAEPSEPFGSTLGLKLPHLSDLWLQADSCMHATDFLSQLIAPITILTLGLAGNARASVEAAADTARCVETVSQFPLLRRLSVLDCGAHAWPGRTLEMMLSTDVPARMVLQQLHTLCAFGMSLSLLKAVAQRLRSTVPGLRCLSMAVATTCRNASTRRQWADICEHISLLQLQQLSLDLCLAGPGPSLYDLGGLTCLSALRVDDYDIAPLCFEDRYELPAFAQMSQLRCLHLEISRLKPKPLAALMPHLASLPGLTCLVLDKQAPASLSSSLSACVPGAWPVLHQFGLSVNRGDRSKANRALVRAACRLPVLKQLALLDTPSDESKSDISEILRKDLDEEDILQELKQIAEQAGVAVSSVDNWCSLWSGSAL